VEDTKSAFARYLRDKSTLATDATVQVLREYCLLLHGVDEREHVF